MDVISYTIRERVRIKGEIRALTAQAIYSGRALAVMPVGLLCILYFLNRTYEWNSLKTGFAVGFPWLLQQF
jgi:tight adherence protein B